MHHFQKHTVKRERERRGGTDLAGGEASAAVVRCHFICDEPAETRERSECEWLGSTEKETGCMRVCVMCMDQLSLASKKIIVT